MGATQTLDAVYIKVHRTHALHSLVLAGFRFYAEGIYTYIMYDMYIVCVRADLPYLRERVRLLPGRTHARKLTPFKNYNKNMVILCNAHYASIQIELKMYAPDRRPRLRNAKRKTCACPHVCSYTRPNMNTSVLSIAHD